jgi:DNA-binding response OmpR family regulator
MAENKHILVVDDETELCDVLRSKLEAEGFMVSTANDGEEALERAFEGKPDLILLDLVMPNKDGFEVLTELREDKWGKDVPVILLTNLDDYESLSKVLEKQGHEYLVKTDWKIEEVVEKIKQTLEVV